VSFVGVSALVCSVLLILVSFTVEFGSTQMYLAATSLICATLAAGMSLQEPHKHGVLKSGQWTQKSLRLMAEAFDGLFGFSRKLLRKLQ